MQQNSVFNQQPFIPILQALIHLPRQLVAFCGNEAREVTSFSLKKGPRPWLTSCESQPCLPSVFSLSTLQRLYCQGQQLGGLQAWSSGRVSKLWKDHWLWTACRVRYVSALFTWSLNVTGFLLGVSFLGQVLIRSAGGLGQVTTSTSIVHLICRWNTEDLLLASHFPPISIVSVLLSPDNAIMINVDLKYSTWIEVVIWTWHGFSVFRQNDHYNARHGS